MKGIELTQGKVALVDDEDFDYLNQWKWHAARQRTGRFYAKRGKSIDGHVKNIWLHRIIMKTPPGLTVDHIDHDGLNCQKSNLRNCTISQNSKNRTPIGKTKYLGVSPRSKFQKTKLKDGTVKIYRNTPAYKAFIKSEKGRIYLGKYKDPIKAARAYDRAAKIIYGEFANLNFKQVHIAEEGLEIELNETGI
jgi:phenylalanyl-tRNA synthetase alpha subunit